MNFVALGLILCTLYVGGLLTLFRYEDRRGVRILQHFRIRADFVVLQSTHVLHTKAHFFAKIFPRQVFHYVFHTFLFLMLRMFELCEKGIRNIMRTNKTLARSVERENMVRSKLEEIAIHKAEVALTEEEKYAHREKTLNGM